MATKTSTAKPAGAFTLPLAYTLLFLTIEPISTVTGFIYAVFYPRHYMHLLSTSISSPESAIQVVQTHHTTTILTQLGNLYLLLSLMEAFILRSTADVKVWKTLLACMLVADVGHVASCYLSMPGVAGFWQFWDWNALDWGNLGFVYVAALLRICFLRDVGMGDEKKEVKKA